ncbi:type II toxin-antitoxin system HipA family toxin [Oxalobacteraceae bacterium R-40]|uniref:Type II toxin-antitoxin system HipA family toxin n=1 Tax=Keguizhuia sedimenti TaxID=3064264 RepID=A0ABU1BSL6_9BURK|nr:type II toxin-antitoxin system HipA family toxin [Oxalobacteraceae bacterium R-40]
MSGRVLSVYMGTDLVGILYDTEPISFAYDASWLSHPQARPLSDDIPLQEGRNDSAFVYAFFENLLPEGEQRKLISLKYQVSTVFGMLARVGGDTAGSIALLLPGEAPEKPSFQKMTWQEIDSLIHANGTEPQDEFKEIDNKLPKPRLSISGAQFKLLLSIDDDGSPLYPLGATPSTHIVKPDIVHGAAKLFATAANETIVMTAARLSGLPCAHVFYQPIVKACMVERYDRVKQPDGSLRKLWQADFCQLLGKPSDIKYEHDKGPTFAECYFLLKEKSARQAVDLKNLLRWLFFNLYVGNNDSHTKNLSLIATDEGLRLAPFYDLMCTQMYSGLSNNFAFSIGGEFSPGRLKKGHIIALAETLDIKSGYLLKIAREMADLVGQSIPQAAEMILPHVNHAGEVMIGRLQQTVSHIINKTSDRIWGADT